MGNFTTSRRIFVSLPALMAAMGCLMLPELVRKHNVHAASGNDPWTQAEVVKPEGLAKELSRPVGKRLTVICVGFESLYRSAHIPGALALGPGRQPKGIEALKKWARGVSRDEEVVLYCGCCPWNRCPNIRPAYGTLREMGFKQLRVLQIDDTFESDWVAKGFPVEKGN